MDIGRVLARLELKGRGWALAALTAGVAGSSAVIELAQRMPAQDGEASRGGRFERAEEGADQSVPAENPA
jgi:hypothetical protein